jgi:hypothetical protein
LKLQAVIHSSWLSSEIGQNHFVISGLENHEICSIPTIKVMNAILYLPRQQPLAVSNEGLCLPGVDTDYVIIPDEVPPLLGCVPGLVDILACGTQYVAYSIFDSEGDVNLAAMEAVAKVSGIEFNPNDDDEVLRGPVMVVTG